MSTPYPYTDERVTLPSTSASPNASFSNRMRQIITDFADPDTGRSFISDTNELHKALSAPHDYEPVDRDFPETTAWGNVVTFTPTANADSTSHAGVLRNCEALGYLILNHPSSLEKIKAFQPSPRRYFHFNTPHSNSANADLFVINYTKEPADENHELALAGSKQNLKTVSDSFTFDTFRPQHGHAYLTGNATVDTVKATLDEYSINYAVHKNHTGLSPLYESFSPTTHNTVITKFSKQDWSSDYAVHKYDPATSKACCGALKKRHRHARILTEETATNVFNNSLCQRDPCQLESNEGLTTQETL